MSAKKVSKMCIFVHKLVEIARFSPRKVQKRGFFAGGRGDFLAGQKRGFLGISRASRGTGKCNDTSTQTAQMTLDTQVQYRCLYKARLTYSATLITRPVPNPSTGQ